MGGVDIMSTIGILGAGRVGSALANKLARTHEVTLGVRDVAAASAKRTGAPVALRGLAETARTASIVINAMPGSTSLERLSALREELSGKILIDVANATEPGPDGLPAGLCYPNSSLAEHLQAALPATAVVKTLNTVLFAVMVDPALLRTPATAFLSGNDERAKATVSGLLCEMGWRREWIDDLGDITTARATEAMILLVPHIIRKHGFAPFGLAVVR
jgi:predicted dinucleotide-binding enzyme